MIWIIYGINEKLNEKFGSFYYWKFNMISKDKAILITWWNGFVWANLVRKLVGLWYTNVFLILRESSNLWRINDIIDRVYIKYWTLADENSIEQIVKEVKPEIIYHLAAAWAYIWRDGKWVNDLFTTNILWTINLLNACKENWFEYFVSTWSSSEYWIKDHPIQESELLEPNNEYWISKASATMYCNYIWKKFQLPVYTFRIFSAFWPYEDQSRLIPSLMLKYINNESPNLSNPNSVRDYIYVEDIVNYYLNIDEVDWKYWEVFNLASWKQHNIWEMVNMVKEISNSDKEPNYWATSVKQDEPKLWEADMNKTKTCFDIQTTSVYDGLKITYNRFKENKDLYY